MNISEYKYLTADSRSVFDSDNTIFAAIRTDIGDGHRYISELYRKGVRAFIVADIPDDCDAPDATFLVTNDVPTTLGNIAHERLGNFDRGIVITGSIGKTKTKELLFSAFQELGYDVRRSPRSWNSSIGVPLAIWDMTIDGTNADVFITEAGIDGPQQGDFISDILANSHKMGIITPITDEHDEAFKSHSDKIKEKLKLLAACDTIIYDNSDPLVEQLLKEIGTASGKPPQLYPIEQNSFSSIYHALADKALELHGIPENERRYSLNNKTLVNKKRQITDGNFGNTIICDYFTHDLRSLQEALDFMRRRATPAHGSVLVLDDLQHLQSLDSDGLADIYRQAFALAYSFGVECTLCISKEYEKLCGGKVEDASNVRIINDLRSFLDSYHNGELLRNKQILLFGKSDGPIGEVAAAMESAGHDTTLEIDLDALTHNYNHFRSLVPSGTGIIAMVKASAYGLGPIEIGKTLQSIGAASLAVAVIEEGIALREAGIRMPVLVLNPVTNRYPALFAHQLEPVVFSLDELDRLVAEAEAYGTKAYPLHIKLDTGMHRVGFTAEECPLIATRLADTTAVKVKSVFSHLATADCLDLDSYTYRQLDAFSNMTTELEKHLGYRFERHILNTAGMMRFAGCGGYEMARLGIGLYGISPYDDPNNTKLQAVATFRSHIISVKKFDAGTPIGYGCNGIVQNNNSLIATVPVGYADGINRRLGNGRACFFVKGTECPTIGNICMDLCMIDVSAVPGIAVGDAVEIFGTQMRVERIADILETIPYEVLTAVSQRVKRTYVKN